MRPGPLLLTAAAALAGVHVVGVLFARPLYRPAEVLAALCLLAYAIRYDLLPGRTPAPTETSEPVGGGPDLDRRPTGGEVPAPRGRSWSWGPSAAAAALVAGAAVSIPPSPGQAQGLVILSPEEYSGWVRRTQLESLVPVAAALLFVLVLLVAQRRRAVASPVMISGAEGGSATAPAQVAAGSRRKPGG